MISQANRGRNLEELITFQNGLYKQRYTALIHKVPTEWIPIRDKTGKVVTAKVDKKAAVDYLGTWKGKPVAFDAKHTLNKRISWSRLEPHQEEFLRRWKACGGISFVLVGLDMKLFYLIPIEEWGTAGKSVVLPEAPHRWLIPQKGGLPDYVAILSKNYGG